ncbi:MAG: hypothetical protein QT11_C0001G0068 [archaeon GW2011_AR20]|nr:MAG: hypothetical protein QT11_C0001G0068 [archaeon GW2011_AR20]MBS3160754.1 hypothetical protein [Candidatus Woesearchaeota archaeon]
MGALEIIQAILAGILIFFLTGFLIINKFFKELGKFEKIMLSIGISLCITILIGVILGFLGVFSLVNSLIAYGVITILILIIKK